MARCSRQGRSPVSIEGTNYDLNTQLSPDPAQQIALALVRPGGHVGHRSRSVGGADRAIRDRNGNPVPDGTQVRFVARDGANGQILDTVTGVTEEGAAEGTLSIERPGQVVVVASSGESVEGRPLLFRALPEPTATPTARLTPTATRTVLPTATATQTRRPTPTLTPTPTTVAPPGGDRVPPLWEQAADAWQGDPVDVLAVAVGTALVLAMAWVAIERRASAQGHEGGAARHARAALLAWIGALVGLLAWGWGGIPIQQWIGVPSWVQSGLVGGAGAAAGAVLALAAERSQRKLR